MWLSSAARVRAVSETSMFEAAPVVSDLAPSEVALRTLATGAPPPTCTGRPSIPLILFAIAHSPRGIYNPLNGPCFRNFRPAAEKLALSGRVGVTQVRGRVHSSGVDSHHPCGVGHTLDNLERIEIPDPNPLFGGRVRQGHARGAYFQPPGAGDEDHALAPMYKECGIERVGGNRGAFG